MTPPPPTPTPPRLPSVPIGEALRRLRISRGLKQVEVSKLAGAPDFRTISHWETHRKIPSFRLLSGYLAALGMDFHDLQDALDRAPSMAKRLTELGGQVDRLARIVEDLSERRQVVVERRLLAFERRFDGAAVAGAG